MLLLRCSIAFDTWPHSPVAIHQRFGRIKSATCGTARKKRTFVCLVAEIIHVTLGSGSNYRQFLHETYAREDGIMNLNQVS
jgi:hypothetical protein